MRNALATLVPSAVMNASGIVRALPATAAIGVNCSPPNFLK